MFLCDQRHFSYVENFEVVWYEFILKIRHPEVISTLKYRFDVTTHQIMPEGIAGSEHDTFLKLADPFGNFGDGF